jgi:hypothetical protein
MGLLQLVILLIVVGVLLWLMNTYLPMDPMIRKIINILVIIVVVLWLLSIFGLFTGLGSIQVPRVR